MERVGDVVVFDRRALLPVTKDGRIVFHKIEAGAGDAKSADGDVVGRDVDGFALTVAANFGAVVAESVSGLLIKIGPA